jgi:hypothetical protein
VFRRSKLADFGSDGYETERSVAQINLWYCPASVDFVALVVRNVEPKPPKSIVRVLALPVKAAQGMVDVVGNPTHDVLDVAGDMT